MKHSHLNFITLALVAGLVLTPHKVSAQSAGSSADPFNLTSNSQTGSTSGTYGNVSQYTSNQTLTPPITAPTIPQNVPGLQSANANLMALTSMNMTPIPSAGASILTLFASDVAASFLGPSASGFASLPSGPLSYGFPVVSSDLTTMMPGLNGGNDYYGYNSMITLPQTATSSFDGNICDMPCRTTGWVDPNSYGSFTGGNYGSGFGQAMSLGQAMFGGSGGMSFSSLGSILGGL